jgi:hypothetical protein
MSSTSQLLAVEFEALKNELIARYDELGMRASGQWANSLTVEASENSAGIIQESYGEQLEFGRKPGKQPPSEAIEKWIKDRGIAPRLEKKISISSLAFIIARKIGREGWNRQEYGGTQLISSIITPDRSPQIIDKIGESQKEDFTCKS